jgi:ankyrin repeat protein
MGESWAVIALAQMLPGVDSKLPQLKEAEPQGIEPWAETVLFGSEADVKRLLDGGFDPNSATRSGGTTALMPAAPDVGKMRLLLDRGAKADARAKNRYSALLVAANYPGSSAAMNLPLYNAHPIFLAAFAGNTDMVARLRKEGDRVDDKMNVLGMFPLTPLMMLATWHRTDAVRALLDAGARVDEPGRSRAPRDPARRGRESRRQERHEAPALCGVHRLRRLGHGRAACSNRAPGRMRVQKRA